MKKISLRELYPISLLFVLKRNVGLFLLLSSIVMFTVLLGTYLFGPGYYSFESARDSILARKSIVLGLVLVAITGKLAYEILYWLRYDYFIQNGRLHIETGVLMREEASVPLTFLSEFYLKQNWFDFLFGTRELTMKTALGEGQVVARIDALKDASAKALKGFLIKQASENPEDDGEEVLMLPEHT